MTKIVIDKENEIKKLENMLETLTDEKDKQSVRFAINIINGFNEVLSERPQGEWIIGCTAKQKKVAVCNLCNCISFQGKTNFCHNCGADMRGGENNEQRL